MDLGRHDLAPFTSFSVAIFFGNVRKIKFDQIISNMYRETHPFLHISM